MLHIGRGRSMSNEHKFEAIVERVIYEVYELVVPEDNFVDGVYHGSWEDFEGLKPKKVYEDKQIVGKKFIGVIKDD